MGEYAAVLAIDYLEEKDREVGDEQSLYTRSNEEIEPNLIVLHARSQTHIAQSTVRSRARQSMLVAAAAPRVELLLKAARRTGMAMQICGPSSEKRLFLEQAAGALPGLLGRRNAAGHGLAACCRWLDLELLHQTAQLVRQLGEIVSSN